MQQPPDLFDIIHFEAPQIRKFYDDFLQTSQKTPKKSKIILKIISSPLDQSGLKSFKEPHSDLFNELLEQENRLKSPFSIQKTPRLIPFQQNTQRLEVNITHILNEIKGISQNTIESFKPRPPVEVEKAIKQEKPLLPPPEIKENLAMKPLIVTQQQVEEKINEKKVLLPIFEEKSSDDIKKRKRKSNSQLKVLKIEFEKEAFWDKEKILQVSKSTGLSESQVYKWFWDQKKKKAEITRELHDKKMANNRKFEDHQELGDDEDRKKIKKSEGIEKNAYRSLRLMGNENISKKLKFEE